MFRFALALVLTLPAVAVAQTHQVKLNGHTFTLPAGLHHRTGRRADLAPRPIVALRREGPALRLRFVAGRTRRSQEQLEKKPHRIVRLEDTNGDGKFDKQTVFVKNVMFPEGAMWLNGSLYVAAPPHIWKFTDTNDDGVADKEEIWFDGKTLTGCANDLHGPYRGPDGWIYWCKGAFAKQEYTLPNGKKFTTRASHIFRARPDGTGIEPVMTGGMDNPVDVVFTPGGDIIFSDDVLPAPARRQARRAHPRGLRRRLRQGPRPGLRAPVDAPDAHAADDAHGPGRAVRAAPLRERPVRQGVREQHLLLPVQPAEGEPARAGAERLDVHDEGLGLRRVGQHRLPPDGRDRGRRRLAAHRRYRRLVQALLPDVAAREAGRDGGDLPREASRRAQESAPSPPSSLSHGSSPSP